MRRLDVPRTMSDRGHVPALRSRVRIRLAFCIFLYTIGASLMSQVYPKVSAHA